MLLLLSIYDVLRALWKIDVYIISTLVNKMSLLKSCIVWLWKIGTHLRIFVLHSCSSCLLKMDFHTKIKNIYIHLYFIATQYLWNYALVSDIDNWTWTYIVISIYWNRQNTIVNGLVLFFLSNCRKFESR